MLTFSNLAHNGIGFCDLTEFLSFYFLMLMGKMCANVFTNNSIGEGMDVKIFEMDLNVFTNFKQQVCCTAQTV